MSFLLSWLNKNKFVSFSSVGFVGTGFWSPGLPDVFSNPNVGKFWRALEWKMLEYFCPFGIIYGLLVQFVVIWYIFTSLLCLDEEKSGNLWTPKMFGKLFAAKVFMAITFPLERRLIHPTEICFYPNFSNVQQKWFNFLRDDFSCG
jgi:hypothetical protein